MRRRLDPPGLLNIWPAFTDVLGGLVVVLVFLTTVFVIAEVLLGREMANRDTAIGQLANVTNYLEGLLGDAQAEAERLQGRVANLEGDLAEERSVLEEVRAQLAAAEAARSALEDSLGQSRDRAGELERVIAERDAALARLEASRETLEEDLSAERERSAGLATARDEAAAEADLLDQQVALLSARAERIAAELERLNRALYGARSELQEKTLALAGAEQRVEALQGRLAARDETIADQAGRIQEMDRLIKRRLLDRVEELETYTSDFLRQLREVFADNPNIKIVGDRFVFQSEVLFPSGEADLSTAGQADLDKFVAVFRQLQDRLPEDLPVIIEVQGHTDRVPIRNERFRSNWELSSARALEVVDYLISQGIPPRRLAATGMAQYHPVDEGNTPEARRRNRRIELKITSR